MKNLFTLSMIFVASVLFAQEGDVEVKERKLSIGGSVDAYYNINLTSPNVSNPLFNGGNGGTQSFGTSFADEVGFALGMANLIASYEGEKTGVVADLAFGPRGNSATGGYNINQLYAYWNVSDGTTLTLGRFNTYLGYEVISPVDNFNYSTSYLFSNGPFSHVGLKADFALSDDFSVMLAVMNPTDINNNVTGDYALGAQLGYADQFLNFYYDNEEVLGFEVDYTGGFNLTEDFFFGINAAYADNNGEGFMGAAFYPQLSTSDNFSIGLRGEYFDWLSDADKAKDDADVFSTTLTASYTVDNLIIKPELRLDSNSQEVYFDNDLKASNMLSTFTIAAIYKF